MVRKTPIPALVMTAWAATAEERNQMPLKTCLVAIATSAPLVLGQTSAAFAQQPIESPLVSLQDGTDRPGLDYRYFVPAGADPELCRHACELEKRCRAFAYHKPAQDESARCWLKAGIPQPRPADCCAAGTKGTPGPDAVKSLFEKRNLVGIFAVDCSKPPSRDNEYVVHEIIDPSHVQRTSVKGTEGNPEEMIVDSAVELKSNEIAFSGRKLDFASKKPDRGMPIFGEWRIEPGRMLELRRWEIYDQHYYLRVSGGKSLTANPSPSALSHCPSTTKPVILSINHVLPGDPDQWITITGSGFGKHEPYVGNSPFIRLSTSGWNAGSTRDPGGDAVTLSIKSWSDSQIHIDGLRGAYGQDNWKFVPDEKVTFEV
jgi:hypothetical protein